MGKSLLKLSGSPVRKARKQLNKTVQQAADGADIHWQAWFMTECGCYNDIPPKIASYLANNGLTIDGEEYTEFRKSQQRDFGELFAIGERGLPPASLSQPPIRAYREHIGVRSRTSFAKGLCVQPALMYRLENGQVKYLPDQIYQALLVAGLSTEDADELDERTTEYFENAVNRQ